MAGDDVARAAGRERHDDADRLGGPGLRERMQGGRRRTAPPQRTRTGVGRTRDLRALRIGTTCRSGGLFATSVPIRGVRPELRPIGKRAETIPDSLRINAAPHDYSCAGGRFGASATNPRRSSRACRGARPGRASRRPRTPRLTRLELWSSSTMISWSSRAWRRQFGQRLAEFAGVHHVLGLVDRPQEGAGYVREVDRVRVHGRALCQWVGQEQTWPF